MTMYDEMDAMELTDEIRDRDFEIARLKLQLKEANYVIATQGDFAFPKKYLERWGIDTRKAIMEFDTGLTLNK